MADFFMTTMGHRFYESTMPRIATALETIAKKLGEKPYAVLTKREGYTEFRVRRPDGGEVLGSEPKDVEATKNVIRGWYPDCEFEVLEDE